MTQFNKNLELLNPTLFVNDKNYNIPLKQLLENDEYILKFLNGNRLVLKSFLGNLLDFNESGEKILVNGGRFNSYKKCNTWKALKAFAINNDEDVTFDEANEMLVYKGYCDTPDCLPNYNVNRETWLEREIFIPEILRGQQIVFAIKAATLPESTGWTLSSSMAMPTSGFETLAVEILNGEQTVQEFVEVGPWSNETIYEHDSFVPPMLTAYVPFRVKPSTQSVKIKIFRTTNSNYLHINKMFLGAITLPYDNTIEKYSLDGIDIGNFYDFDNDVAKVTATTVVGHKVAKVIDTPRQNDLLLMYHMYQAMSNNFASASILTSSPPSLAAEHGLVDLPMGATTITINHQPVVSGQSHPQVTLVSGSSSPTIFFQSIYNVNPDNFSVALSAPTPDSSYKISWFLPTVQTSDIINTWAIEAPTTPPTPTEYPDIFGYEDEY